MGVCGRAGGWADGWAQVQEALRQRVAHVLVPRRQQLLLLVRAGQRVAAVVGAHVECRVHRVGEVCGLERDERPEVREGTASQILQETH